ncbi:MAG: Asp23/Gls24 family envelope stress response protein [Gaiellaceae bacterium]
MEGQPLISPDVLARYAADAALEVDGVAGLADGGLHRGRGVAVTGDEHALAVSLHLELEWGRGASEVGNAVQRRVAEYLERMADSGPASVDVVFEAAGAPPPSH